MSEMAEPSIGEFEFVLFGGEWIVGEADDLSAVLYAIGVAKNLGTAGGVAENRSLRHAR